MGQRFTHNTLLSVQITLSQHNRTSPACVAPPLWSATESPGWKWSWGCGKERRENYWKYLLWGIWFHIGTQGRRTRTLRVSPSLRLLEGENYECAGMRSIRETLEARRARSHPFKRDTHPITAEGERSSWPTPVPAVTLLHPHISCRAPWVWFQWSTTQSHLQKWPFTRIINVIIKSLFQLNLIRLNKNLQLHLNKLT